jgi:NADPH-dependent curcumin reductase CurA
VVRRPLEHHVVLADLQDREALFDPDDLALRLPRDALIEQPHRLGDPLLALEIGRVAAADHDSFDKGDVAEVDHRGRLLR